MCSKVILNYTFLLLFLLRHSLQHVTKRSPLEVGYVQFTTHHPHGTIHLPSIVVHNVSSNTIHDHNYQDHWIPGHVENHIFIPGRVHHVLVPHALVVHALVLHPVVQHMSLYRKHYGGFGVGVDYGGRGAGHGFHVVEV